MERLDYLLPKSCSADGLILIQRDMNIHMYVHRVYCV